MRAINQNAAKVFDQLTEGMNKIGDHKKIKNEPYMALSIEIIGSEQVYGAQCLEISFCHYGEQNGDLMRDPEMCFLQVKSKGDNGKPITFYYPSYYRNDYMGSEQFTLARDGNGIIKGVYSRMQNQQAVFAGQWAQNLKDQGFIEASKAMNARPPATKEVATVRELLGDEEIAKLTEADLAHEDANGALCLHLPATRESCEGKEFSDYPQDYAFAQGA